MKKILILFIALITASTFAANGIKVKVINNTIINGNNDTLSLSIDNVKDGLYIYKDSCLYNICGKRVYPIDTTKIELPFGYYN